MDDLIGIYDEAISAYHCESLIKFINKLEACDNLGSPAVGRHTTDHRSYNASCNRVLVRSVCRCLSSRTRFFAKIKVLEAVMSCMEGLIEERLTVGCFPSW